MFTYVSKALESYKNANALVVTGIQSTHRCVNVATKVTHVCAAQVQ